MRSLIDETRPWKFVPDVTDDCRINPVSLPHTHFWGFFDKLDFEQKKSKSAPQAAMYAINTVNEGRA